MELSYLFLEADLMYWRSAKAEWYMNTQYSVEYELGSWSGLHRD